MLELERRDDVAILKMNHGKVNAMDIEFCQAMTGQVNELAVSEVSAVVLTSSTHVFSAGVDLRRWISEDLDYVHNFLNAIEELFGIGARTAPTLKSYASSPTRIVTT